MTVDDGAPTWFADVCTCEPSAEFLVHVGAAGGFEAVAAALGRKLEAIGAERCWVTVARDERDGWPYFANLGMDEQPGLYSEVCGNFYIGDEEARLGPAQLQALRDLGWADPVDDDTDDEEVQPRNHTRSWPSPIDYHAAAAAVIGTLVAVHGLRESDRLRLSVDGFGTCPVHGADGS